MHSSDGRIGDRGRGRGLVARFVPLVLVMTTVAASGDELTPLERPLTAEGFEKIAEDQGVVVYQDPHAEVIRIAAEGELPSPPEQVRDALLAYDRQVGVIARVSESRVLSRGADWLLVYQRLNLPVISDRDYTLRVRWGQTGSTLWVTYKAVTDEGPPARDDVVRVVDDEGSWQLEPAQSGQATKVRFQTRLDLAGSLPHWMARSHAGSEIPELFASIGRLARGPTGEARR